MPWGGCQARRCKRAVAAWLPDRRAAFPGVLWLADVQPARPQPDGESDGEGAGGEEGEAGPGAAGQAAAAGGGEEDNAVDELTAALAQLQAVRRVLCGNGQPVNTCCRCNRVDLPVSCMTCLCLPWPAAGGGAQGGVRKV
jgi:hypothetical protein